MNHLLKKVAKEVGINERLCLNSARKSFTQYATNLGCDMMVTNYIVGHSGSLPREMKVMEYYAKGNMELAFLTMKKVFDYVDDPSKYDSDLHAMMMRELTE